MITPRRALDRCDTDSRFLAVMTRLEFSAGSEVTEFVAEFPVLISK